MAFHFGSLILYTFYRVAIKQVFFSLTKCIPSCVVLLVSHPANVTHMSEGIIHQENDCVTVNRDLNESLVMEMGVGQSCVLVQ